MNMLKDMITIERAELLSRILKESLYATEKDKDIALYWLHELLEPINEKLREPQEKSNK